MDQFNQQPAYQPPPTIKPPPGQVYPPPGEVYAHPASVRAAAHPPKNGPDYPQQKVETKDRGGGFWRGCCAGMCCCCLLDMCF